MMHDKKIVVASLPFTDTTAPIMAPALLKSVLNSAGFDCVGLDLNAMVYNQLAGTPDCDAYLRFFYHETVDSGFAPKIYSIFNDITDTIMQHAPDIVCLSLLHYQCQVSAKWLSFCLKRHTPAVKIVIGGAGAFGNGLVTHEEHFILKLQQSGLIDHYISGDGDIALVELCRGNLDYAGIDSMGWKPIDDLSNLPFPNYDDYNFSMYDSPFIGILGSRGCVRQCTFCDIHEYWEKFKYRTGENIFQEMLFQNQKYGIRHFKFQDSLVNGNVKEYNNLISLLAEHNRTNPQNAMHWVSYFIFRPASQMKEEQWKLTAESGAVRLNVGIESLIESTRTHIKKKFSNADIEYGLDMAKKYNIPLAFLMMVGYVTETEQDHIETLKWLEEHKHYANDPIQRIASGGTLAILPGTWLERHQEELGVTWKQGLLSTTNGQNHLWEIKATGNNYETRVRRQKEFIEAAQQNGFRISSSVIDPQKELENVIKEKMLDG